MESVTNLAFAGFGRILVATDGSPASDHAIAWARELAKLRDDARVWVVHVVPHPRALAAFAAGVDSSPDPVAQRLRDYQVVERALRALDSPRAEAVLGFGDPTLEIVSLARGLRCDVVVMGSHQREGVEGWLLGSVSSGVKDASATTVLIARSPPARGPVVVALDDSDESVAAGAVASFLASRWDADLCAVHVAVPSLVSAPPRIVVPDGASFVETVGIDKKAVASEIVSHAQTLASPLVVAGNHRHAKLRRRVIGSVGHQLARDARASVLLVRAPTNRDST